MSTSQEQQPEVVEVFQNFNADNENTPAEIESLCMNCHENGTTRLLLTRIPFFREIILMSFECPQCGYRNTEVQFGGKVADQGCTMELKVESAKDLNRQIVKSDSAQVRIPELDFEIPPLTQKGVLSTVEGMITTSIENLSSDQPVRRIMHPELSEKIDAFIEKLQNCLSGEAKFTVIIDDPAGNSNIQNLCLPHADPQLTVRNYPRTLEQNQLLGLGEFDRDQNQEQRDPSVHAGSLLISGESAQKLVEKSKEYSGASVPQEVMEFPENCYNCGTMGTLRMIITNIPFFKEVVLMAFCCEKCGYKSNEIKGGGAIHPKGKRIQLAVTDTEDLSRDVLKSETASVIIPEVELEITHGTMGGMFTTVEGLLEQLKTQLGTGFAAFSMGDSSAQEERVKMRSFLDRLDELTSGKPFTLIIDDPLSNSYLQNIYAPDPDPNMIVEEYDRTFEQNEDLGLNDLKTD